MRTIAGGRLVVSGFFFYSFFFFYSLFFLALTASALVCGWRAWLSWYGFGSIIIGGVLFSLSHPLSLLCVCVCVACMG